MQSSTLLEAPEQAFHRPPTNFILGTSRPSEVDKNFATFNCPIRTASVTPLYTRLTSMSIVSMLAGAGDEWRFFTLHEYEDYLKNSGSTGPDYKTEEEAIDGLVAEGYITEAPPNGYVVTPRFAELMLGR